MAVLAMRSIGKGRAAATRFSAFMNLPNPVSYKCWNTKTTALSETVRNLAETQMKDACAQLRNSQSDEVVDIGVSIDGAWQTRGMSAHHGLVAAISIESRQVVDSHLMTNQCATCDKWKDKDKDSLEYMDFVATHFEKCHMNHDGSSASMERDGAVFMYEQSVESRGVRYNPYVGDGDTKSFKAVQNAKPYGPDYTIRKEECIGHIQKRMGTRLRNLLNKKKGIMLSDGKGLGGQKRLTLARVDYIQFLYGQAIRDNAGNVDAMCKQTMAILHHYADPPNHKFCVPSKCSHLHDPASAKAIKDPLPKAVVDTIQPIFQELSSRQLLEGCVNLHTQNANESFHSVVWSFVPKEQNQSRPIMELGLNMAILVFNRGYKWTAHHLYNALCISLSSAAMDSFCDFDEGRIHTSIYRSLSGYGMKRAKRRNRKRARQDAFVKTEGVQYKSGIAHCTPRKCRQCHRVLKGSGHKRGKPCPFV
jgi:hypothetical protein